MSKRLLAILMTAVMLATTLVVTSVTAAQQELVLGDVDGQDGVTILDATAIQRHLAAINTLDDDAVRRGMVTGGSELSILDATAIQRYLAGIIDRFPADEPTEPTTEPPTEPPTQPQDEVTKVKDNITIYFSNNKNWSTVNAYVYDNATGTPMKAWPGSAMKLLKTNDYGEQVYSMTVDVAKYDRIIFNNGTDQTTDTPLTKANSGYFINSKKSSAYGDKFLAGVYPYGQDGEGKVSSVSLDYPEGYKKRVYIWTPEGYDPADKTKKYHVLYMCDGQNLFGQTTTLSGYEWECDETVLSMMKNGGDGVIVVGIDNSSNKRNHELTPNLGKLSSASSGDPSYQNGGGKEYADFVVDTVIPYIEANYNVSTVRGVAGSSSGGIEAFYIGMEHRDKFSFIGALSPAFILYDKATWNNYLSAMDFSENTPRIYFYCGNGSSDALEQALYTDSIAMESWLKALGYPSEQMITVKDADATHSEGFWALYFPEMLSWGMEL